MRTTRSLSPRLLQLRRQCWGPSSAAWGCPQFYSFFTSDDLIDLEQCAVDAQSLRDTADLRLEEPEISSKLKTFHSITAAHNGSKNSISRRGRSSFVN